MFITIIATLVGMEVIAFIGARMSAKRPSLPNCAEESVNIGATCLGGTIYAGVYGGSKYMITPGGCAHESGGSNTTYPTSDFTPACPKVTDVASKQWRTSGAMSIDHPGVETISAAATPSTILGDANSAIIASITEYSEGGYHPVARYCDKLNFGGFTDWYLPSKSEMAYIYCKSKNSGNVNYPHEDPNCATHTYAVGSAILPHFVTTFYLTSTESSAANVNIIRFSDGFQSNTSKPTIYYFRCVRRIGPDFIGSITGPSGYDSSLVVSGLNVDYTGVPESTAQTITIKNNGDVDATGVTATVSAGFSIVGGTCGPSVPLAQGATCTVDVKGVSTNRWENDAFSGTLTLSNSGKSSRITLTGTTVNLPDPCYRVGAPVGALCTNGAYYGGVHEGEEYMVAPSGCGYEPSGTDLTSPLAEFTPTCAGTDSITKRWNENGATSYDIPDVENVASGAIKSSTSFRGNVNTREIVKISTLAQGGYHPAARYCDRLQIGGFQDWYLPSKSELTYLACRSKKSGPNPAMPSEDPDCATYGYATDNTLLMGFVLTTGYYHSSTEQTSAYAWSVSFNTNAATLNSAKTGSYYVRCLRRKGPHFIASPPAPGTFDVDAVVTNINVNYTNSPESTAVTVTVKNQGDLNASGVTASVTSGFELVAGGTCSPSTPVIPGGTCTLNIRGTSASRWYNGAITGTLTLADGDRISYVALAGTSINLPDPCSRTPRPVGVLCNNGLHYIGEFGGSTYFTTPSNCSHETGGGTFSTYPTSNFTPTCDGSTIDQMTKSWKGSGASDYDIPGIENITSPDPSTVLGDVNTSIAAAITASAEGGYHPAARYCYYLNYGGYTDWYLPSKTELAFIGCRSKTPASGVSPAEDPGCANFGYGSSELIMPGGNQSIVPGLSGSYWSSTERNLNFVNHIAIATLGQGSASRNGANRIRCIRRQ